MKNISVYHLIIILFLTVTSCKKKAKDKFDRTAMLTNMGNLVIVPAYAQFNIYSGELKNQSTAFTAAPSLNNLDSIKLAFLSAYLKFQAVETYSFSAAVDMRSQFNSFTPDTDQINSNIASGSYDLTAVNNLRAKGFPALDYLLFGMGDQLTIDLFTTDANAQRRKQYLADLTNEIQSAASSASSEWANNFITTFINSSGTDIGSSMGILVNDMSFASERCRRERVGYALGYVSLLSSGQIHPQSVESYYSVKSRELLAENLKQLKTLYTGSTEIGFDDYLDYLNADYNGQPLSAAITNQFDLVIQKTQNVPVDFSTAVNTNKAEMESIFLELKKLTVMLKVDMSSQLGVIINYSDNDGD